jgi:hypothetical protein
VAKKIILFLVGGSLTALAALCFKVTTFAQLEMLIGRSSPVTEVADANVFRTAGFIADSLKAATDFPRILLVTGIVLAIGALLICERRVDCVLLLVIPVMSIASFWMVTAPWLRVINVLQDHAFKPEETITGSGGLSQSARENWACVVCSHVTSVEQRIACPAGHSRLSAQRSLSGQLTVSVLVAVLTVIMFAYLFWARGDWLDVKAGDGRNAAVLAVLSVVAYTSLAINIYSVAYLYGKTAADTKFQRVTRVDDNSTIFFKLIADEKRAFLMYGIDGFKTLDTSKFKSLGDEKDILDWFLKDLSQPTEIFFRRTSNASSVQGVSVVPAVADRSGGGTIDR